ncbi:Gx transporter family protein [Anaerovoracaceae bacterium 41-7]|jgi:heptaprenyl diphosphate synthase|uniref:Gx transporter family protein n=1 Tax=unclassified Emergencia TaxID=2642996 RepID=UPI00137AD5D4|nr:Gx transporter family protein [Emergencia sp. 1XD21-10]MCI9475215.1 Gx transporter family protein [Emergencia sp.]NCE99800.1 Gx transporter family protein [Emergencia sp. 1XD21-10]
MQSQISTRTRRTKALALSAMFACLALIFSYVEAIIPFNIGIPGVKLGLANLVIVIALYELNFRYAFVINMIRILLAGLLFSGVFGALYSLAGGILSLLVMWILKKTELFSMVGISMAGGVAHNMGQLLVAAAIVSNLRMFLYFPILMFSGLVTGILMGIVAYVIDNKIPKSIFR